MFPQLRTRLQSFREKLLSPVDISSLVFFRIGFGLIMVWEVYRYLEKGRVFRYYIEPEYVFPYYGFEWVQAWPGDWMYVHFWVMGIAAACITLGLFYRVATVLFFLMFTQVFLIDKTQHLNHFYLIILLSLLLCFIPAHKAFSLDALRKKQEATDEAPAWALWILVAQLSIVYFYAGLAKINSDWVLRGEPLRSWMSGQDELPLIGPYMEHEFVVWTFVYGGLLLDLLVAPLLLWKRTRIPMFLVVTGFHLMNAAMFDIGVFPWMMIAATTLYFEPDWARRFFTKVFGSTMRLHRPLQRSYAFWLPTMGLFLAFQILFPFRHFLYPGDVAWTEEGHRYSWRMKLRDKETDTLVFTVRNPQNAEAYILTLQDYLNDRQIDKMATRPDMILQFSHHIAKKVELETGVRPQVFVHTRTNLNGNPWQPLIDDQIDLASQPINLRHSSWIVPLMK